METLQGLAAVLDMPFEVPSPFETIQRTAGDDVAVAVATAFKTSHQMTDVWAALRYHHARFGQDLHGWIIGRVFAPWQTGHDRDMSDLAVTELRELAWEWTRRKS